MSQGFRAGGHLEVAAELRDRCAVTEEPVVVRCCFPLRRSLGRRDGLSERRPRHAQEGWEGGRAISPPLQRLERSSETPLCGPGKGLRVTGPGGSAVDLGPGPMGSLSSERPRRWCGCMALCTQLLLHRGERMLRLRLPPF